MAVTNPTHRDIKKTREYMEQMSWDDVYEVLTRIPLTINTVTSVAERPTDIQGNASLTLAYDGSGNLSTLTKTIGSVSYIKTFTWTGGNLTNISTWSIV